MKTGSYILYYVKKYPLSLVVIAAVIYLSFFRPPSTDLDKIPNIDKVAHVCMYGGLSGMLWLEFLRNHRKRMILWHAWVGAVACPILFSGTIELLQEYATTYRGGDWMDFLANTTGVVLATLFAWYVLRPRIVGKSPSAPPDKKEGA